MWDINTGSTEQWHKKIKWLDLIVPNGTATVTLLLDKLDWLIWSVWFFMIIQFELSKWNSSHIFTLILFTLDTLYMNKGNWMCWANVNWIYWYWLPHYMRHCQNEPLLVSALETLGSIIMEKPRLCRDFSVQILAKKSQSISNWKMTQNYEKLSISLNSSPNRAPKVM